MTLRHLLADLAGSGTQYTLEGTDGLYVGPDASIISENASAIQATGTWHMITVRGHLAGQVSGIRLGNDSSSGWSRVTVAEGGLVSGGGYAVWATGYRQEVVNNGDIHGQSGGVWMDVAGPTALVNNGTISGQVGIVLQGTFGGVHDVSTVTNYGTLIGFENAYWGSNTTDRLINRGTIQGDVRLNGASDTYDGRGGTVEGTVHGNDGSDRFFAGAGVDHFDGGNNDGGFDELDFRASAGQRVSLMDGSGTGLASGDRYFGFEVVKGSLEGADTIIGDGAANTIWTYGGDDRLEGRGGVDSLYGGEGNDLLIGGTEADTLHGGEGIDTAAYSTAVTVSLDGTLTASGEAVGDTFDSVENLNGSVGADRLRGNALLNTLRGGEGNDLLEGGAGNDRLIGGEDDDKLAGGAGADVLTGGEGADQFLFTAVSQSLPGALRDRIMDFDSGEDRIVLTSIDANTGVTGNQAFVLDLNGSFSAGEIRQVRVNGDLRLDFNIDADLTVEMSLLLKGQTTLLEADDFML